jgi:hypothetical protein
VTKFREPTVRITPISEMIFSKSCYEIIGPYVTFDHTTYVKLSYLKKDHAIILEFIKDGITMNLDAETFIKKLRFSMSSFILLINARECFNHYNIQDYGHYNLRPLKENSPQFIIQL